MTPNEGLGIERIFAFYDKRGYQQRLGPGQRPAIVVIDFSNAFTAGETDFPGGDFSNEIDATRRVLQAARVMQVPIFYTTIAYADPHKEAGLWGKKVPWLYHCKAGTAAVEIDFRLESKADELVIVKHFPSAFHRTDLPGLLSKLNIDTLLIAGCTTSVCVRATAVDAMQYGYRTLLIADAIGEFDPQLHALHLRDLDARYADVVSIEDALSYLATLKSGPNTSVDCTLRK